MIKQTIIEQSPLRILDSTLGGGLGAGNIGLLTAAHGVGKTAALVHIATDQLLQGKHVLHVTFHKVPSHVIAYYEEIFQEISRSRNLEQAMDVHDEIVRNRSVMNLETYAVEHLVESLELRMNQGGFRPDTLVIEDFDFQRAGDDSPQKLKEVAKKKNLEIWVSHSPEEGGVEVAALAAVFDVVMHLRVSGKHIHLELHKAHGRPIQNPHLLLDPKTLLIVKE